MKIIIDTREKDGKCLEFSHPYITDIVHQKLNVGDYWAEYQDGYRPPIVFERKGSLSDLFNTLSGDYKRFKKEILRSKEQKVLLVIIIEGSLTKVLKGYERSQRSGEEITKQLFTLLCKHHIPCVFCNNREEMVKYITEVYLAIGRLRLEKK